MYPLHKWCPHNPFTDIEDWCNEMQDYENCDEESINNFLNTNNEFILHIGEFDYENACGSSQDACQNIYLNLKTQQIIETDSMRVGMGMTCGEARMLSIMDYLERNCEVEDVQDNNNFYDIKDLRIFGDDEDDDELADITTNCIISRLWRRASDDAFKNKSEVECEYRELIRVIKML
eukprot:5631_1